MSASGSWGDDIILHAAANCYETPIRVISSLSDHHEVSIRPDRHHHRASNSTPLVLGHVHEFHYVSLRAKTGNVFMS